MKLAILILIISASPVLTQERAIVSSKTAHLYLAPTPKAKVLLTVFKGRKLRLEATARRGGFYKASTLNGAVSGWIHGDNIRLEENIYDELAREYLDTSEDKWVFFDTIRGVPAYLNKAKIFSVGTHRRFWLKSVTDPNNFKLVLIEAHCKNQTLRYLQEARYSPEGNRSLEFDDTHQSVVPDTVGEAMLKEVCRTKR